MTAIINTKIGVNRGKSRVWLEGRKLEREGFEVGMKYDVKTTNDSVVLMLSTDGKYMVSKRTRNGRTLPIIELKGQIISDSFEVESLVRVVVNDDKIVISVHHSTVRQIEREERLLRKLKAGDTLSVLSLCHGGGVLDSAVAEGLKETGIKSVIAVAVELERKYLESSLRNNPELWDENSCIIEGGVETVNLMKNPTQVDLCITGLPCLGASRSGASKLHLEFAESHQTAGAIFFWFLSFVQTLNPSLIVVENVDSYQQTSSMVVIRSVLKTLGYNSYERILDGNEYGALERRKRLCLVAISKGVDHIDGFDIDKVKPLRVKESYISEILENVPLESDRYKPYDYLRIKEIKDQKANKGFSRQILTGEESYCGVIGRGYQRARSTEPFVAHPIYGEKLTRLFTVPELCRLKTIPERIVRGLSENCAMEIVGQAVIFEAFKAVGVHLANHLNQWAAQH